MAQRSNAFIDAVDNGRTVTGLAVANGEVSPADARMHFDEFRAALATADSATVRHVLDELHLGLLVSEVERMERGEPWGSKLAYVVNATSRAFAAGMQEAQQSPRRQPDHEGQLRSIAIALDRQFPGIRHHLMTNELLQRHSLSGAPVRTRLYKALTDAGLSPELTATALGVGYAQTCYEQLRSVRTFANQLADGTYRVADSAREIERLFSKKSTGIAAISGLRMDAATRAAMTSIAGDGAEDLALTLRILASVNRMLLQDVPAPATLAVAAALADSERSGNWTTARHIATNLVRRDETPIFEEGRTAVQLWNETHDVDLTPPPPPPLTERQKIEAVAASLGGHMCRGANGDFVLVRNLKDHGSVLGFAVVGVSKAFGPYGAVQLENKMGTADELEALQLRPIHKMQFREHIGTGHRLQIETAHAMNADLAEPFPVPAITLEELPAFVASVHASLQGQLLVSAGNQMCTLHTSMHPAPDSITATTMLSLGIRRPAIEGDLSSELRVTERRPISVFEFAILANRTHIVSTVPLNYGTNRLAPEDVESLERTVDHNKIALADYRRTGNFRAEPPPGTQSVNGIIDEIAHEIEDQRSPVQQPHFSEDPEVPAPIESIAPQDIPESTGESRVTRTPQDAALAQDRKSHRAQRRRVVDPDRNGMIPGVDHTSSEPADRHVDAADIPSDIGRPLRRGTIDDLPFDGIS